MSALPCGAVADDLGELVLRVGLAHAGVHPVPGGAEGARVRVVGLGGEHVEVGLLRLVDELQVRQGRRALLDDPGVERLPHRPVRPVVLGAEGRPTRSGRRQGGRSRPAAMPGPFTSSGLHETMRTNGSAGRHEGGERDHVVLDDDVRL